MVKYSFNEKWRIRDIAYLNYVLIRIKKGKTT